MWTQDSLAGVVGVRRESVSIAMGELREDGLIKYHRGSILIVESKRLEARACQCYRESKLRWAALSSAIHNTPAKQSLNDW